MDTLGKTRLVALGNGVWLDEIRREGEHPIVDVPGGSVTFATLGARLFTPSDPTPVSLVFNAGNDFPQSVIEVFRDWSVGLTVNHLDGSPSSRGLVFYSKANSNRKGFQRLTEPLPIFIRDLAGTEVLKSRAFHFFGTAQYILEQVADVHRLRGRSSTHNAPSAPFVIWEPHAKSCLPSTLDAHQAAARSVDVFSPNHEELASFFAGEDIPEASDRQTIERQAQVFLDSSIGNSGKGCMLVRCAEAGCLVLTRTEGAVWLPSFYGKDDSAKVVDPTGAGNGFLGAVAIGWQDTGSYVEAAKYGQVAASFMIEQIGCPSHSGEGGAELWNGCSVRERLAQYQTRTAL